MPFLITFTYRYIYHHSVFGNNNNPVAPQNFTMAGKGRGKKVTASTAKKQTGRRQTAPGNASAAATGAQTSNIIMMEILLDLSSRMSVTEELLAPHKETELKYPPAQVSP